MQSRREALICLTLFAALILSPRQAASEVCIVDGGTLAMDGQRVRLFGIDAPDCG